MKIGVIGAGAWGTALAQVAAADGEPVVLWAHESDTANAINATHQNSVFLPGVTLSASIEATGNLTRLTACDAILVVTPAQHVRALLGRLDSDTLPLILCAKGIEAGTQLLVSEVAAEVAPHAPIAVLSGPSFAHEVAKGLPAALTLACADAALGERLAHRIARPTFRPYLSDDVIGAAIGGASKNVIAIGCGVVEGTGLGLNARAALISRGFAEMSRFGRARGARAETLAGLSGLGDLMLTCSSTNSRNFSLGKALGEGVDATALIADCRTVAEGAFTAPVLEEAAATAGVEMPVTQAVSDLIAGRVSPGQAIEALLTRPLKPE